MNNISKEVKMSDPSETESVIILPSKIGFNLSIYSHNRKRKNPYFFFKFESQIREFHLITTIDDFF